MGRRPALNVGLYLFSHIPLRVESLLWLILTSVTWFGFLIVYTLIIGVDRAVDLLKDIARKSLPTSNTPT